MHAPAEHHQIRIASAVKAAVEEAALITETCMEAEGREDDVFRKEFPWSHALCHPSERRLRELLVASLWEMGVVRGYPVVLVGRRFPPECLVLSVLCDVAPLALPRMARAILDEDDFRRLDDAAFRMSRTTSIRIVDETHIEAAAPILRGRLDPQKWPCGPFVISDTVLSSGDIGTAAALCAMLPCTIIDPSGIVQTTGRWRLHHSSR